jgi:hypothetical protein
VVYLFVVCDTLILHIVFQYFKVAILAHRIDVIAVSPELSSPEGTSRDRLGERLRD